MCGVTWLALKNAGKEGATRHMRYRGLRRFFGWLYSEGDIEMNPIDGVTPAEA